MARGRLFELWWESGGNDVDGIGRTDDKWACVTMHEKMQNSHHTKLSNVYEFLDVDALQELFKDTDLVNMHIARLGEWTRISPKS